MSASDVSLPTSRREDLLRRFENATEWPLLVLSVAMVPVLLVPLLMDVSDSTDTALEMSLWVIWAVFAVELGIRTALAERRIAYLGRNWIDVLIVAVPFLRPLRIARSARALRLVRLSRVLPFLARAYISVRDIMQRRGLQYVGLVVVALIFGAAAIELALERKNGTIDDYGTALWWAMSTVSTVGYGDAVPTTPEGKGVAVLLMLVGIGVISWVTANVAAYLVESGHGKTATTGDLMLKLESLESEIQELRAEMRNTSLGPNAETPST
jgi:voltage-gated potassium channel